MSKNHLNCFALGTRTSSFEIPNALRPDFVPAINHQRPVPRSPSRVREGSTFFRFRPSTINPQPRTNLNFSFPCAKSSHNSAPPSPTPCMDCMICKERCRNPKGACPVSPPSTMNPQQPVPRSRRSGMNQVQPWWGESRMRDEPSPPDHQPKTTCPAQSVVAGSTINHSQLPQRGCGPEPRVGSPLEPTRGA
jgi:hypothetical protein